MEFKTRIRLTKIFSNFEKYIQNPTTLAKQIEKDFFIFVTYPENSFIIKALLNISELERFF